MLPSLRRKLEMLAERRDELERLLADPSTIADNERFRAFSREFAQLEPVAAALAAEAIIELQVARFLETSGADAGLAPLKRLRAHGQRNSADVLARAKQQLAAGADPHAVLDYLAHTLTNRLLHAPTAALRAAALSGDAELARAAEKLFPPAGEGDDADPAP